MNVVCDKKYCTGCASCYNICPKEAIVMEQDELGFYYPVVNQDKCIDCGKCQFHCPVCQPVGQIYPSSCYAVALKDDNELSKVASGGAISQIATGFIKKGGVVYSASGENMRHVMHIRIDQVANIENIKGSKYVQSEIGNVYALIREDLK